MNVGGVFFEAALVNLLLFFWLASGVTTVRLARAAGRNLTTSLLFATFLGPVALVVTWIWGSNKSLSAQAKGLDALKSLLAIAVSSVVLGTVMFLALRFEISSLASSEKLVGRVAIFLCLGGFMAGLILAGITKRVAFFESVWVTVVFALGLLGLHEQADTLFSYGTSSTYFSTLMLSNTVLLLIFLTLGGAIGYLVFGDGRPDLRFAYERFIGFRFLMTKRSSQVVSLITVISVLAVMIACAGMIVVMSVMNGFSSDLRSKILGANAHLMVLKYGNDFTDYRSIIDKTASIEGVASARAFILKEGMVSSKRNLAGAMITGIDIGGKNDSEQLLKYVSKKSLENLLHPEAIEVVEEATNPTPFDQPGGESTKNDLPGVILGREMAIDLQVFVGDVVNIISPVGEIGPTGPIPKAKPFRVAGLFESGMYEYDAKFAYMLLKDAQEFFTMNQAVSGVEYRVVDVEQTRRIAKEIDEAIDGYPYYTRDWMQMNRPMFSALQLEKIAMLIILGTLIFMASLLILVTLIMVVMEKGKEIAILKSMGATDVSIMKIFVTYGLCVGMSGAFSGGVIGVGLCLLIEKVGIRLDPDVYYFANLPVRIESAEVSLVVFAAILISFLATIPPSLFAARLRPVEGLRYE